MANDVAHEMQPMNRIDDDTEVEDEHDDGSPYTPDNEPNHDDNGKYCYFNESKTFKVASVVKKGN